MKYARWGLAVVLALTLSACGESSGNGDTDPTKVTGELLEQEGLTYD